MMTEGKVRKIAVFTAHNHFAKVNSRGELVIYFRKPVKTLDERVESIAEDIHELVSQDPAKHAQLLAEINKKNQEFWKDRSQ